MPPFCAAAKTVLATSAATATPAPAPPSRGRGNRERGGTGAASQFRTRRDRAPGLPGGPGLLRPFGHGLRGHPARIRRGFPV